MTTFEYLVNAAEMITTFFGDYSIIFARDLRSFPPAFEEIKINQEIFREYRVIFSRPIPVLNKHCSPINNFHSPAVLRASLVLVFGYCARIRALFD